MGSIGLYGFLWVLMGSHGFLWVYMGPFGFSWVLLCPGLIGFYWCSRSFWVLTGPFGSLLACLHVHFWEPVLNSSS